MAVPRGVEPPTFGLGNRCSAMTSHSTVAISDYSRHTCSMPKAQI